MRVFGGSLRLRRVRAGGCNAWQADANVLETATFDTAPFGVQFVVSPLHADGLLVTKPVTENLREALLAPYKAVPHPRIVIASGACATSLGPFAEFSAVHNGVDRFLPVDLYVPRCPPSLGRFWMAFFVSCAVCMASPKAPKPAQRYLPARWASFATTKPAADPLRFLPSSVSTWFFTRQSAIASSRGRRQPVASAASPVPLL